MAFDGATAAGFLDPVLESQACFRSLLEAMSRPARPVALQGPDNPPAPLYPTTASLALTLLDPDTPLWLDPPLAEHRALRSWIAFHSGAPLVEETDAASFALIADPAQMPRLDRFALGDDRYPDRAATLILQVEGFTDEGPSLYGPGCAQPLRFGANPLPDHFWAGLQENAERFPRGLDLVLASPTAIAALPRSLKQEAP